MRGAVHTLLAGVALAAAAAGHAADRALIIGIGVYQDRANNLPGIDKDVTQMSDIAKRLGFANPTLLRDAAATRDGILAAMRAALVTGVGPNDRVLIYYSGHGTQAPDDNNDEPDARDEALVAYDVVQSNGPNGPEIRGLVTDDEIGALLKESPSRNVMLVIDACNSGSIDRSVSFGAPVLGTLSGVPKFYRWALSTGRNKAFGVEGAGAGGDTTANYVSLSAAGDDQSAIATKNGSAFTVGLAQAITERSADGSVTPDQMLDIARRYITANISASQTFTPEIHGDTALRTRAIRLSSTSGGAGPNWTRANELIAGLPQLSLADVRPRYRDGEALSFTVESPAAGYLNVIDVGPDDSMTLLYPNKFNPDNRIAAGSVAIPTAQMPFTLPARAPYGRSMLLAIVTAEPINLLKTAVDGASATLATPSLAGLLDLIRSANPSRSFSAVAKPGGAASGAWAGKAVTEVCGGSDCR